MKKIETIDYDLDIRKKCTLPSTVSRIGRGDSNVCEHIKVALREFGTTLE